MTNQELLAIKKKLGKNVRQIRESKNLSLRELSANCDLDNGHIGRIERGMVNVALGTLFELAKGLSVPVSELIDFK